MMNLLNLIEIAFELGLQYSLITIALVISFKIIKFPDMSVDGTFSLGAAITAVCIQNFNSPLLGICLCILFGIITGIITASLHVYLKINKILSGILVMISLYSVNLRIMGRANIPITNENTLISWFEINQYTIILLFFVIVAFISVATILFFKTEIGLIMRATGDNPKVTKGNGRDVKKYTIIALCLSSVLVALAGSLVCQRQGYSDINMGTGMIIIGLACLFIGDSIMRPKNIPLMIVAAIIGTIIYEFVISLGLRIGLSPSDLKILTAIIVVLALSIFSKSREPIINDNISFDD